MIITIRLGCSRRQRETQFFFFLTASFSLRVFVFMCWIKPDDGREGTKWLILKQGPLIVVLSTWGRADAALNIITDWVIVADAPPLPPHSTDIHTHTQHTHPSYTHTPNCGSGGWGGRKQSSPIKSSFNHLLKQVNILLSFFLKKNKTKINHPRVVALQ